MKRTVIVIISVFFALAVAAQPVSPCYMEKFEAGVALFKKGNYTGAKSKFYSAKNDCPHPDTKQADEWIRKCNDMIKSQNPSPKGSNTEVKTNFPTPESCGTVSDIDGNEYHTVQIGTQCWMSENLRTTRFPNGEKIPVGNVNSEFDKKKYSIPYCFYPNNSVANVKTYGLLYNWCAIMNGESPSDSNPSGVRGICPNGWHIPSSSEWTQLEDYINALNGESKRIAKYLCSKTGWNEFWDRDTPGNKPEQNNATSFSAIPAGKFTPPDALSKDGFYFFGGAANYWSSTESHDGNYKLRTVGKDTVELIYFNADKFTLESQRAYVERYSYDKNDAISVRCVRD